MVTDTVSIDQFVEGNCISLRVERADLKKFLGEDLYSHLLWKVERQ